MEYAMSIKSNSTLHYWEQCKSKSHLGAKQEATRKLRSSMFCGDTLLVAQMCKSQRTEPEYRDMVQYRIISVWDTLSGWRDVIM